MVTVRLQIRFGPTRVIQHAAKALLESMDFIKDWLEQHPSTLGALPEAVRLAYVNEVLR